MAKKKSKKTIAKSGGKASTRKTGSKTPTSRKASTKRASTKLTVSKKSEPSRAEDEATSSGVAAPPRDDERPVLEEQGRRGQLASERARFDLGEHRVVLHEELGELPPGYDLTIVRGWIRDPRHVVLVWDVNDPDMVTKAETVGWQALAIRVLDSGNAIIADVSVGKRSGTFHVALDRSGVTLRLALGIHHSDGFFETLALSGPVRVPPEAPAPDEGAYHALRLPEALDRRVLVRSEPPPRPGHRPPSRFAPQRRLAARIELAAAGVEYEGVTEEARRALTALEQGAGTPQHDDVVEESWSDLEGREAAAAEAEPGEDRGERQDAPSSAGRWRPGGPSSDELISSPGRHRYGR